MFAKLFHDIANNAGNLIAALSSLGTFITAFIALRAIQETKRQRESSYQPEIYIASTAAELISPDFGNRTCAVQFIQDRSNAAFDNVEQAHPEGFSYDNSRYTAPNLWIYTHFHNIGLGAAKAIEYYWYFDFDKATALFRDLSPTSPMLFSEGAGIDPGTLSCDFQDKSLKYYSFIDTGMMRQSWKKDFIESKNVKTTQSRISVSMQYIDAIIHYLFYKYKLVYEERIHFVHDDLQDLPPLFLHLSYRDIQNKIYNKSFRFSFTFSFLDSKAIGKLPSLSGFKNQVFGSILMSVEEDRVQ